MLTFVAGIDVNSRFTSLLRSGLTSESWYGNCFGAHCISHYWGRLQLLTFHLGCTKRGSGWHRSRVPLGWNSSDRAFPLPLQSLHKPQLFSPLSFAQIFFRSFPFLFSTFVPLITACLSRINPCVRISACGAIFQPYSKFWTIDIFPLKLACTVVSFFLSFSNWFFGRALLSTLIWLPVSSNRVKATMTRKLRSWYDPSTFLHSCIAILNKSRPEAALHCACPS